MIVGLLSILILGFMGSSHAHDINIYKLHIVSDIAYRFATTNVTSYLVNRANTSKEAEFKLTIPDEAFINKFFMIIDGKIYHGTVKGKEAAQRQYDEAKKQGQSAGQVRRWANTKDNIFEVQVNIAAESKVEFSLTYQELLQRKLGIYEHVINLDPGQIVKDLQVEVNIRESRKIVLLEVPELREEHQNSVVNQENPHAVVERPSDKEAIVTYAPDSKIQKEASKDGIAGQFVVEYDVERTQSGGDLLVVDGYFVHFFAPSGLDPVPKDIMFILDVSGSMSGNKLNQLKIAMDKIVTSLRAEDRFNIITFATRAELWEVEGLIPANSANLQRAKQFVGNLQTRGSTNINDALLDGINFLKTHKTTIPDTTKRPAVVIFLTDGMPNESESNPTKIAKNLVAANKGYASVFSLGFGNDVDFNFLKSLSLQNDGFARKIYVNADPVLQLQNFYEEVSTPLLTDVNIHYLGNTVDNSTVTPTSFLNFFKGSEIVVAGKLKDETVNNIVSQVSAGSSTGLLELAVEANVTKEQNLTTVFDVTHFTERLWAYLTIKKMLDKKLQTTDTNITAEAKQKALDLALKYQFVTPLTSMVVTKPNETEQVMGAEAEPDVAEYDSHRPAPSRSQPMPAMGRMPNLPVQHSYSHRPAPSRSQPMPAMGRMPILPVQHSYISPAYSFVGSGVNLNSRYRSPMRNFRWHSPRRNYGRMALPTARTTSTTTTTPVPTQPLPTCLSVIGVSGDFVQLIFDQHIDIVVNGKLRQPRLPSVQQNNGYTYFTKLAIMHSGITLQVKPNKIHLNKDRFDWNAANGRRIQDISLTLSPEDDLIVKIGTVLRMNLTSHRYFLEIQELSSQLDPGCSRQQNPQLGVSQSNSNLNDGEVQVSLLMADNAVSKCIHAYTQTTHQPASCHVIRNNQWNDMNGKMVRHRVTRLTQKNFAVQSRSP